MAKTSRQPAVLAKGLRVRGRVRGDGDLQVDAEIEGDVEVSGALELGEDGRVVGGVQADSVVVAGTLEGDVQASGTVALSASARMRGDVRARELTLDEGASFVGSVEVEFDLPDEIA